MPTEKSKRETPSDLFVHSSLFILVDSKGQVRASFEHDATNLVQMIQKALDLDPQNGAYLDSLGWVYYRQNKFKLAERYLRRSLEKYKHDPTVLSHLGDVYFKHDQTELAKKHWRRSIEEWERSAPSDRDDDAINELRKKLSNITPHFSSGATNDKKLP